MGFGAGLDAVEKGRILSPPRTESRVLGGFFLLYCQFYNHPLQPGLKKGAFINQAVTTYL